MSELFSAIVTGVTLGLAAGLAPGPLMTLTISQSIRHGFKEGAIVSTAPFITDIPIVLLLFFVLRELPDQFLGGLGIIGAFYLVYLAYETAQTETLGEFEKETSPASLRKGVLTNFLSPQPYIFWITVGVPYVVAVGQDSAAAPWGFIAGFYAFLVGAKVAVAALIGHYRSVLTGKAYPYVMRALALALVVFAFFLFREGLHLLGVA